MKGERKTPTRMLIPSENQLEPTFLMICSFSSLRMKGSSLVRFDVVTADYCLPHSAWKRSNKTGEAQPLLYHTNRLRKRYAWPVSQDTFGLLDAKEDASGLG